MSNHRTWTEKSSTCLPLFFFTRPKVPKRASGNRFIWIRIGVQQSPYHYLSLYLETVICTLELGECGCAVMVVTGLTNLPVSLVTLFVCISTGTLQIFVYLIFWDLLDTHYTIWLYIILTWLPPLIWCYLNFTHIFLWFFILLIYVTLSLRIGCRNSVYILLHSP